MQAAWGQRRGRVQAEGNAGAKQKVRTGEPVRTFYLCAQRDSNP